jgi:hypothetical protein
MVQFVLEGVQHLSRCAQSRNRVAVVSGRHSNRIGSVLKAILCLHCIARSQLEPEEFIVPLLDLLKVLLILNLELVKIDHM